MMHCEENRGTEVQSTCTLLTDHLVDRMLVCSSRCWRCCKDGGNAPPSEKDEGRQITRKTSPRN